MTRIAGSEATGERHLGNAADIGDLTGRVALVTGANSGIGYETAKALADHGAHVILACRDEEKARRARDKMESELDRSSLELLAPRSGRPRVGAPGRRARCSRDHARLDILVNNAGVMGTPYRQTADGFELQMATNHLGHFALTGLLLDRIVTTERSRIVTVSSHMHRMGRLRLDDVAGTVPRNTWVSLRHVQAGQPPLHRRAQPPPRGGGPAHPGPGRAPRLDRGATWPGTVPRSASSRLRRKLGRTAGTTFGQSTAAGALPILCAATSSSVRSGQYIGPARLFGLSGPPRVAQPSGRARDAELAAGLWRASEELTGVRYSVSAPV